MLRIAEALALVIGSARPLPPVRLGLAEALGLVLAEPIRADLDLPPFDKSLVDGYAVRSADLIGDAPFRLRLIEEVHAGATPTRPVGPGEATAIMTGAPLPEGADAVVMVERTDRPDIGVVTIRDPIPAGRNRIVRGWEIRAGAMVAPAGTRVGAARSGLLASVGAAEVAVHRRPVVAIAATGDELVPIESTPGPGQIRNSNSSLLSALAREHGADPVTLPITADRPEAILSMLRGSLGGPADLLLVSGGVSMGARDLVPGAMIEAGVRPVFHKVRLKPGKPLWFGVGPERTDGPPALVFGLPGNPISGLACFLLFVRPALAILAGEGPPVRISLPLITRYEQSDDRDTCRPARVVFRDSRFWIDPLAYGGSSDLGAVASGDGFAIFPAGERIYHPGDPVEFVPFVAGPTTHVSP